MFGYAHTQVGLQGGALILLFYSSPDMWLHVQSGTCITWPLGVLPPVTTLPRCQILNIICWNLYDDDLKKLVTSTAGVGGNSDALSDTSAVSATTRGCPSHMPYLLWTISQWVCNETAQTKSAVKKHSRCACCSCRSHPTIGQSEAIEPHSLRSACHNALHQLPIPTHNDRKKRRLRMQTLSLYTSTTPGFGGETNQCDNKSPHIAYCVGIPNQTRPWEDLQSAIISREEIIAVAIFDEDAWKWW